MASWHDGFKSCGSLQKTGNPLQSHWNFKTEQRTCGAIADADPGFTRSCYLPQKIVSDEASTVPTGRQSPQACRRARILLHPLTQMSDAFDRTGRSELGP